MLCRAFRDKGESELWLSGAVRFFHPIPKLHVKRNVLRMVTQYFEELLESSSHDRPLPGNRALRLYSGSNTLVRPCQVLHVISSFLGSCQGVRVEGQAESLILMPLLES